jgi:hypothetical protein
MDFFTICGHISFKFACVRERDKEKRAIYRRTGEGDMHSCGKIKRSQRGFGV